MANATTHRSRARSEAERPSQMNNGNNVDVSRPIDSNPPRVSGGMRFAAMNTPYARPSRRVTGMSSTSENATASRFNALAVSDRTYSSGPKAHTYSMGVS